MEIYYNSDFILTDNIGVDLSALDFDIVYYTSGEKTYIVSKRGAVCLRCLLDADDNKRLIVRFDGHGLRPGILHRRILFFDSGIGSLDGMVTVAIRQHVVGSNGEKVRLVVMQESLESDSEQNNVNPLRVMDAEIQQIERNVTNLTTMTALLRSGMSSGSGNIQALIDRMSVAESKLSTNTTDMASLKTRITTIENEISNLKARVNALEGHVTGIEFTNIIPQITAEDSYDYSATVIPLDTSDNYTIVYDINSTSSDSREESDNVVTLHYIVSGQETVLTFNISTGLMQIIGSVGVSDIVTVTATAVVDGEPVATVEQNTEISIN